MNLDLMAKVIDDPHQWRKNVIKKLTAFLPIISGTRMMIEYLKMRFEKNI
jgi:hypothetical protein